MLSQFFECGVCILPGVCLYFFPGLFLNKFMYLFIFGCAGSSLLCVGTSLVAVSGGYYLLQCMDFSLQWFLLFAEHGL